MDFEVKIMNPYKLWGLEICIPTFQECVSKCLKVDSPKEKKKWLWCAVLAIFHGVNAPTVANFKIPPWHQRTGSWKEMQTIDTQELLHAGSSHQTFLKMYMKDVYNVPSIWLRKSTLRNVFSERVKEIWREVYAGIFATNLFITSKIWRNSLLIK